MVNSAIRALRAFRGKFSPPKLSLLTAVAFLMRSRSLYILWAADEREISRQHRNTNWSRRRRWNNFGASSRLSVVPEAPGITNPVPGSLARVIPGERPFPTLGQPINRDVLVTAADDIAGMNAGQISTRLGIQPSPSFTVFEFPIPASGIASPINRTNPMFVGGGRTSGGAREFVIPNGPVPCNATIRIVC